MNGCPVLTLPMRRILSTYAGMRTSLEGTQASGEGESHTQEANVAEVSYGEPVTGEPEYPDNPSTTRRWSDCGAPNAPTNVPDKQVTNGVVGSGIKGADQLHPRPEGRLNRLYRIWSLKDHLSARIRFPTWLARYKGN